MKDYKNIDRLFQEKFRDFEVAPPERVWNQLENKISTKPVKPSRPMWMWLSGMAVGLALLFMLNNPFTNPIQPFYPNQNETEITDINSQQTPSQDNLQETNTLDNNSLNNQKFNPTIQINPIAKNNKSKEIIKKSNIKLSKSVTELVTKKSDEEQVWVTTEDVPAFIVEDLLSNTKYKKDKTSTSTEVEKRWSISTVAAPVFLSSFNQGVSALDSQIDENAKEGKLSTAYGVQVAYQFNRRFSVQSGVHMVDYAYRTHDVNLASNGSIARFSNVNYNPNAKLMSMSNMESIAKTTAENEKGEITQVYGYIEIPLEAKYKLNPNGDFGVNLIGGFSTLLLNKNDIYIETSQFSDKLGKASNLNDLNFSGNFGVELEYKVYKNVNFNLVPMLKVQTRTLNNSSGTYIPYSVGLYSGLNLRF